MKDGSLIICDLLALSHFFFWTGYMLCGSFGLLSHRTPAPGFIILKIKFTFLTFKHFKMNCHFYKFINATVAFTSSFYSLHYAIDDIRMCSPCNFNPKIIFSYKSVSFMFIYIFNIIFVSSPSLYPKIVKGFFFNIKDYCLYIFCKEK